MTDRQLYDRIFYIVNEHIQWHFQCEADDVSEDIATDIMNFLSKYKKTVSYIDLGDGNDR
ncbi:hypothetical protein [Megamonas funiformis]|uniref:hypothetical protein n=1 Tax=Megamonas funiformis TaxID=437897 RepID=UPI003F822EF1